MIPIYTIGIGQRTVNDLLDVLVKNNIKFLIDIRSHPSSSYNEQFNKENLYEVCKNRGIQYDNWQALGGFPENEYVLTNGKVDYSKLARLPSFQQHLERLVEGAENHHSLALLCSEGRPEECHRSKCIGVELAKVHVEVIHIDIDNNLIPQDEVIRRITSDQLSIPGFEKPFLSHRIWKKNVKSYG